MNRPRTVVMVVDDEDDDEISLTFSTSKPKSTSMKSQSSVQDKTSRTTKKKAWISSSFGGFEESSISQGNVKRKKKQSHLSASIEDGKLENPSKQVKEDEGLWLDKYIPKMESELAVHKKKVAEVSAWLLEHLCGKSSGAILLLTGPVGCGKTATLHTLSTELGFQIQEWINPLASTEEEFGDSYSTRLVSYQSQLHQFKEFLLRANKYPTLSIFGSGDQALPRKIILIEDLPNLFFRDAKKFHEVLQSYQSTGRSPVVLIISDSQHADSNIYRLLPKGVQESLKITNIAFNPVAHTSLVKVLNRVATTESQKAGRDFVLPSKDTIEDLAHSSAGDIRTAINALQFTCLRDCSVQWKQNAKKSSSSGKTAKKPKAAKGSKLHKSSGGSSTTDQPLQSTADLKPIGGRDSTIFLFRALGKILYCKRNPDVSDEHLLPPKLSHHARNTPQFCPENVAERTHLSSDILNLYLHQNYLDFFDNLGNVEVALEYMSDADMMTSVWMHRTSLVPYVSSITTRAIMFANARRGCTGSTGSTKGGWRPLHKPEWFEINKRMRDSIQSSRELFPDQACPTSVLHTEILPYLAITDAPLKSPGQIAFLQQIGRFQRGRTLYRPFSATLDEKDCGDADADDKDDIPNSQPESSTTRLIPNEQNTRELLLFIVGLAPSCCHGYSSGPPYSKCEDMVPYHMKDNVPIPPQTSASPFNVTVSKNNYSNGETLNVTIEGSLNFKGYILQARSNDSAIHWPVGEFVAMPSNSRSMFCSGGSSVKNTVSHVNKEKQAWTKRQFTWKAPTVPAGNIHFWATVVHSFSTYWTPIKSNLVMGPPATARPPPINTTDFVITKTGCNSTKSCVSVPANCTDSRDCKYLLTYMVSGNNVTIEMSGKGKYVSVGFNDHPVMDKGDDVFCVVRGDGVLQARLYYNNHHSPERQDNTDDVTLLQADYRNQIMKCRLVRKMNPAKAGNALKSLDTDRHLIFAYGDAKSTGNVQYHYNSRWFTASKVNISTPAVHLVSFAPPTAPPTPNNKITKKGCGVTKSCWSKPEDCTNSGDCTYLMTYQKKDENIEFEMSSKLDWVAVGFNDREAKMAGTDTMMCVNINNLVKLHHYDLTARDLPIRTSLTKGDTELLSGVRDGGNTRCKFTRKIKPSTDKLKSLDTKWYLVFGDGDVQGETVKRHRLNPTWSSAKVDLQVAGKIETERAAKLVKGHGCVMSIAWLGLATIGIFMARYMRLVWEDDKLCGKAVWFAVHRGIMTGVVLLSIIGLILIFVHVEDWSNEAVGAHPFVGIVAVGLAIIQPIMALFRPGPGTPKRFIFNWAHRFVGLSAHILAVATLFLAMFFESLDLEETGFYVLIAYCIGISLVLIFEIYLIVHASASQGFSTTEKKEKQIGKVEQLEMQEATPTGLSSTDVFLRKLVLGFVVLLSIGTGVALVVLVAII